MIRTRLGKIKRVEFGLGGYQDAQLGVSFELGGNSWGVSDFWGAWATEWSKHCKWTHAERISEIGQAAWRLRELLEAAKVQTVAQLKGKPIEVTFEGNMLKGWRVLSEVL